MLKTKFRKISILAMLLSGCITIAALTENKRFNRSKHPLSNQKNITLVRTFNLPDILVETSGLIYFNGLAWTFNDSGGEPEIFSYSMADSSIKQRVTLWNGKNYDWEEISQDSSFVYVGDFGNNFGFRNNLCIYTIEKKHLLKQKNKAVKANKIKFTYPDYKPSGFSLKRSAFDCEAMICFHDSIYLFTKNWMNYTSSIYCLPTVPGNYTATKIGVFDSKGLITAACLRKDQLVLLGYMDNTPFVWRFNHFTNPHLNPADGVRFDIAALKGKQTEGIALIDSVTYLISAEKTTSYPQLFVVKIKP
jgi:hypothetical protein